MEKPKQPSIISFEEHKKRKLEKERFENLNKLSLSEIVEIVRNGDISDSEIESLQQFSEEEKYLLFNLSLEADKARYHEDSEDTLQAHISEADKYIAYLQKVVEDLEKNR